MQKFRGALRACDNGLVITIPVQISPLAVWVPWSAAWHAKLYPGPDYMGVWEHYCLEFKAIQGPEKSAFRVGHTCCYWPKQSSKVCLFVSWSPLFLSDISGARYRRGSPLRQR